MGGVCRFHIRAKKPYSMPERERPFGRPKCRWEVNIKINLREVECKNVDCVHLTQNKIKWSSLMNMAINFLDSVKVS
jgi:hypothetical protein